MLTVLFLPIREVFLWSGIFVGFCSGVVVFIYIKVLRVYLGGPWLF